MPCPRDTGIRVRSGDEPEHISIQLSRVCSGGHLQREAISNINEALIVNTVTALHASRSFWGHSCRATQQTLVPPALLSEVSRRTAHRTNRRVTTAYRDAPHVSPCGRRD